MKELTKQIDEYAGLISVLKNTETLVANKRTEILKTLEPTFAETKSVMQEMLEFEAETAGLKVVTSHGFSLDDKSAQFETLVSDYKNEKRTELISSKTTLEIPEKMVEKISKILETAELLDACKLNTKWTVNTKNIKVDIDETLEKDELLKKLLIIKQTPKLTVTKLK